MARHEVKKAGIHGGIEFAGGAVFSVSRHGSGNDSIPWTMDPRTIPHAELVGNLGWVQRLALSLARNADAADDLTQEVARVWLERRPELDDRGGLRRWLAAVARKLAVDRARSESARRAREQFVARS